MHTRGAVFVYLFNGSSAEFIALFLVWWWNVAITVDSEQTHVDLNVQKNGHSSVDKTQCQQYASQTFDSFTYYATYF